MDVKTTPRNKTFEKPRADAGPVTSGAGAGAQPPGPPSDQIWPMRIKLRKPIRDKDGNPTDVIEFREPNTGDLMVVGDPTTLSFETGQIIFDAKKMGLLMARISLTPVAFIEHMSTIDFKTCEMALMSFFLPDLASLTSSTPTG